VSSATKYLLGREGRLRPFAISPNKLYLARPRLRPARCRGI
jgi:hypothetical protein